MDQVTQTTPNAWIFEKLRSNDSTALAMPLPSRQPTTGDVVDRARKYVAQLPPSVQGQNGSGQTFLVAQYLVRGFELPPTTALELLQEYNRTCIPPWSEKELAHKIKQAEIRGQMEWGCKLRESRAPFRPKLQLVGHAAAADPSAPADWRTLLCLTDRNLVKHSTENIALIVSNVYGKRLRRNLMGRKIELDRKTLEDADVTEIRTEISTQFKQDWSTSDISDQMLVCARRNDFHPVRDYLDGLRWDGEERISRVAAEVLCVQPTPGTQAMLRKWMVSAVARVMNPGCKVDTSLILQGPQGHGKSSFFKAMAGKWFTDSHVDLDSKDWFMVLQSTWIHEWSELESVTGKKEAGRVKAEMSSSADRFRPPYGKEIVESPRSCVIVGTTNKPHFLVDETGGRRFWIIHCPDKFNLALVEEHRDQLWAEAVELYNAGHGWVLEGDEAKEQEERAEGATIEDPWLSQIDAYCHRTAWRDVETSEIMKDCLGLQASNQTPVAASKVASAMRALGFTQKRVRRQGARGRIWSMDPLDH